MRYYPGMSPINRPKAATPAKYIDVYSYGVPVADVEFLRPFAERDGHSAKSTGGLGRWAIIKLAKRLRDEEQSTRRTGT